MAAHAVTPKGQITIPKEVRDKCGFAPGTIVSFEPGDGYVILRPQRLIDADQAWFWTPEWQEGMRESEEDVAAGRTMGPFSDPHELIAALHRGWPGDDED